MKEDGDEPVRPSRDHIKPERIFVCIYVIFLIPLPLLSVHRHGIHQNRHAVAVPVVSSDSSAHNAEIGPALHKIEVPPLSPRRTSSPKLVHRYYCPVAMHAKPLTGG